jgi:hypothetical protein
VSPSRLLVRGGHRRSTKSGITRGRPHSATVTARTRRRGDRLGAILLRCTLVAVGPSRHFAAAHNFGRFRGEHKTRSGSFPCRPVIADCPVNYTSYLGESIHCFQLNIHRTKAETARIPKTTRAPESSHTAHPMIVPTTSRPHFGGRSGRPVGTGNPPLWLEFRSHAPRCDHPFRASYFVRRVLLCCAKKLFAVATVGTLVWPDPMGCRG